MRLRSLKFLRLVLVILLITAMGAILWNFLSRRQMRPVLVQQSLLSPEVRQQSTDFVYTEHKEGRSIFKIQAQTSTETVSGIHRLREVSLFHYDSDGNPSERISGDEAIYKVENNVVEVSGGVQIELSDGTMIHSDCLKADLNQEVVFIQDGFRFQMGELSGEGRTLNYQISQRRLRLEGDFSLALQQVRDRLRLTSSRALYDLDAQRVDLSDGVWIQGRKGSLSAQAVRVFLSGNKSVERMFSSGGACLLLESDRMLSGESIHLFLESGSGRIERFQVFSEGSTHESLGQRAVYQDGKSYLEADRIDGLLGDEDSEEFQIIAHHRVLVRAQSHGLDEGRANRMSARLNQRSQRLLWLELNGDVVLRGQVQGPGVSSDSLRGDVVVLELGPDGVPDQARISGNVTATSHMGTDQLTRFDASLLQVFFSNGEPQRIVATTDPVIKQSLGQEKRVVKARRIEALFTAGILENILARGDVSWKILSKERHQEGESQRLSIGYGNGQVQKVQGQDQVVYKEENQSGRLTLRAESAVYDVVTSLFSFSDPDGPLLHYSESKEDGTKFIESKTKADGFQVDSKRGKIAANGKVQTIFNLSDGEPVLVRADHLLLESGDGVLRYTGSPRILQQSSLIQGTIISFDSRNGQLEVENVDSTFSGISGASDQEYRIQAPVLIYQRTAGRARYKGGVRMQSGNLSVDATSLDLLMNSASADSIRRVEARGQVHIQEGRRWARGDEAIYDPQVGRVKLTGELAQIVEPLQGTASGRRLTMYVGTHKIVIDDPASLPTP